MCMPSPATPPPGGPVAAATPAATIPVPSPATTAVGGAAGSEIFSTLVGGGAASVSGSPKGGGCDEAPPAPVGLGGATGNATDGAAQLGTAVPATGTGALMAQIAQLIQMLTALTQQMASTAQTTGEESGDIAGATGGGPAVEVNRPVVDQTPMQMALQSNDMVDA